MAFQSFWRSKGSQYGSRWRLRQCAIMSFVVLLLASGAAAEPLLDAAAIGDISEVKLYLAQGVDVNVMDADSFRPLHWAAFGGYKDIVALLVANGAALDVQNDDGLTPLHTAVLAGYPGVVKQLLGFGANTATTTRNGNTARDMAVVRGRTVIVNTFDEQLALARYQTEASRTTAAKVAAVTKTGRPKPTIAPRESPSAALHAGSQKGLQTTDQTQPVPRQIASLTSTVPQAPENENNVRLRAVATPTPTAVAAPAGQFLIQLASVRSTSAAESTWAQYQKSFPDLLGTNQLLVERVDLAEKGVFYRVRTGPFAHKDQAQAICSRLKAHKKACLIIHI